MSVYVCLCACGVCVCGGGGVRVGACVSFQHMDIKQH